MVISTGPSIRGVCRILNKNSCGSGSICGHRNGRSLFLTNAHVAGTDLGRIVKVEVESTGDRIDARVIMAAYSDKTTSDWAILESVNKYEKVLPVYLSKKQPSGSHYTKGFPRCKPHDGTDIKTVSFRPPVWFWEPDAIGGQSGSGVYSDLDHLQYGLLTWQWGKHGAGQMLSEIYRQAMMQTVAGFARPNGLVELVEYYGIDDHNRGYDDPIVSPGFYTQASIANLPIWAEDVKPPQPEPGDPQAPIDFRNIQIEFHRNLSEFHDQQRRVWEQTPDNNDSMPDSDTPGLFGIG